MTRLFFALTLVAGVASAQVAPPKLSGPVIEIATTQQLAPTLAAVTEVYRKVHPGATIRISPVGSDVAMAWLYTGRADVAVIGREATDPEAKAFEWVFLHPTRSVAVMRGSIATPGRSPALSVRVNVGNPIKSITVSQLKAAFDTGTLPTWGLLGVTGALASKSIDLIAPDAESGTGRYLRKAVLAEATQFSWARVHELSEPILPAGHNDRFGKKIAEFVAKDPAALGIGDALPLAGTRIVPVDGQLPGNPGYPLDRRVIAYSDPRPRDVAADWLSFVMTSPAQAIIARGPYRSLLRR